jgi:hypothetical protein
MVVVAAAAAAWMYSARSFIAEDSYFYAVIARRLALEGRQTFSGVFPTNGFHPLWLYLLAGYSTVVKVMGPELLWHANVAVPLSAALAAIGACFLLKTERTISLRPATLVLPPLVFVSVLGVLYSEAHALLAVLAWLAWLIARADSGQRVSGWLIGSAAAIVVLARLDMIFLAAALLAWMSVRGRQHLGWAGSAAAAFTLLLVPYLATNLWFFGGLMPISGWVKSSFPVPTPSGFRGSWLWLSLSDYSVPFGVVPICFAAAVSALALKRRTAPAVLLVFTAGAIGHMAYTMLFASWCGWHWYYVLAVLTGSLAWSVVLRDGGATGRLLAPTQAGALIVLTALGLRFCVTRDNRSPSMRTIQQYLSSPAEAGRTVFVSELPGEAAFLGRSNIIAADMLTANRQVYARIVNATDPWEALLQECVASGRPLDEVIYIGGAFVARSGNRITWLDPRVSSRRPIATVELGAPVLADDRVPFAVWSVRRTDP